MYRKSIFFLIYIVLLLFVNSIQAQQNDFQVWPSAQVNLEVFDNLRLHLEEEVRFKENVTVTGRQLNDIGISYRLNKSLKAGVFYRLEADFSKYDELVWRNGVYTDLSFRQGLQRFTFGYRLRVQSSKVERNNNETSLFSGFRHRHKISAAYDIKGIPLIPFADAELFVDYSQARLSGIKGLRTWIGLEYTVKNHTISLKYGIDQEYNTPDPLRSYITAVSYTLDLRLVSDK